MPFVFTLILLLGQKGFHVDIGNIENPFLGLPKIIIVKSKYYGIRYPWLVWSKWIGIKSGLRSGWVSRKVRSLVWVNKYPMTTVLILVAPMLVVHWLFPIVFLGPVLMKYTAVGKYEISPGVVNAQSWADDSGNNTDVEIQAALDYANTNGKSAVYIGPGTWTISTALTIYSDIDIIGTGIGSVSIICSGVRFIDTDGTLGDQEDLNGNASESQFDVDVDDGTTFSVGDDIIIKPKDDSSQEWEFNTVRGIAANTLSMQSQLRWDYTDTGGVDTAIVQKVSFVENVVISGFTLTADNTQHGIVGEWVKNYRIYDVKITNQGFSAIYLTHAWSMIVSNCSIHNAGGTFLAGRCYGIGVYKWQDSVVSNNSVKHQRHGIIITGTASPDVGSQNVTVTGNSCFGGYGGGGGISASGINTHAAGSVNITIVGNSCAGFEYGGIAVDGDDDYNVNISGNVSNNNYTGIMVGDGAEKVNISGNTCNSNAYYGVHINNTNYVKVDSNYCKSNLDMNIYCYSSGFVAITNNYTDDGANYNIQFRDSDGQVNGNYSYWSAANDGIYIRGATRNTQICNNHVYRSYVDGIRISATNLGDAYSITVEGNFVYRGRGYGMTIQKIEEIRVIGNEVHDNNSINAAQNGIRFVECTDAEVANNKIYNDTASGHQKYGISIDSNCSDFVLHDNDLDGNETGAVDDNADYTISTNNKGYETNQTVEWMVNRSGGDLNGKNAVIYMANSTGECSFTTSVNVDDQLVAGVIYQSSITNGSGGWVLTRGPATVNVNDDNTQVAKGNYLGHSNDAGYLQESVAGLGQSSVCAIALEDAPGAGNQEIQALFIDPR